MQDETWVDHFDLETKRQSMVWKHVSSSTPKKLKVTPSAGNVMATVFWGSKGVIMTDYLPKGSTVTGACYTEELRKLETVSIAKPLQNRQHAQNNP